MLKRVPFVVIAGVLAVGLASCSKSSNESPETVVKLTSAEVSSLLGITGKDGLEVGEVTSGREGVTVKSITLKPDESTEVEIKDVELRIGSTGKLVYALSSLKIGTLDVLDWKTTQRVRAFGIRVDQPGDRFLTKLEAAISAVRSGGSLRTVDLSCARLVIDRIDYEIRSKNAKPIKVRLESFGIEQATNETLGELSVGHVGLGDAVAAKGLKVTRVDRLWADQMLALLVTLPEANPPSPSSATQPSNAVPVPRPKSPTLARGLLPFDHVEFAELNIDVGKLFKSDEQGMIQVAKLRLDIQRNASGQFAGLSGGAELSVATTAFGKEGLQFFRDMGNPALETTLAGSVELKMTLDPAQRAEQSTASIKAPGLASVSATATTRRLPELLGMLIAQETIPEDCVSMAAFAVEGRDDGLFAYLFSSRFKDRVWFREPFERIPFMERYTAERERLRKELKGFFRAPKGGAWTARSETFVGFKDFVNAATRSEPTPLVRTHFSFTSGPAAATPPAEAVTVQADYAKYKALGDEDAENRYIRENGFDKSEGWMKAAQAGSAEAQVLMGNCYAIGCGARWDREETVRWYRKAAEAGNCIAMRRMAYYGNSTEEMQWYRKAAAAGDRVARDWLAKRAK